MRLGNIVVLVILVICQAVVARAATIEAEVVKAEGDRAELRVRGQFVPQAGDSVAIFYVIPDIQLEASAGQGKVTEVREDIVVVTVTNKTGPIQPGYIARIDSANPLPRTRPQTKRPGQRRKRRFARP